eukprot:CAMPEP_0171624212 /NCGR_PEP_ID=MMETSP0990-20121206/18475_1 /TAXON_ID=483369 /ORGANISM="non described non described, Strain CCMP2098" /LENGTH=37 /DNA_ID= /DNA_START= /DNA_END= /DNA_ORIENTATION=
MAPAAFARYPKQQKLRAGLGCIASVYYWYMSAGQATS